MADHVFPDEQADQDMTAAEEQEDAVVEQEELGEDFKKDTPSAYEDLKDVQEHMRSSSDFAMVAQGPPNWTTPGLAEEYNRDPEAFQRSRHDLAAMVQRGAPDEVDRFIPSQTASRRLVIGEPTTRVVIAPARSFGAAVASAANDEVRSGGSTQAVETREQMEERHRRELEYLQSQPD